MIALEDLLPFTPPLQRFNRIPGAGTPLIGWIICLLSLIWGLMGSWAPGKAFARRSLCTHRSGAVLLLLLLLLLSSLAKHNAPRHHRAETFDLHS
jgi:Ca2+/Na+ antiporter